MSAALTKADLQAVLSLDFRCRTEYTRFGIEKSLASHASKHGLDRHFYSAATHRMWNAAQAILHQHMAAADLAGLWQTSWTKRYCIWRGARYAVMFKLKKCAQTHNHLAMLSVVQTTRGVRHNSNTHKSNCKHHDINQLRPVQSSRLKVDWGSSIPEHLVWLLILKRLFQLKKVIPTLQI